MSESVNERVEELLGRMTRAEKIGQLSQVCKRMCVAEPGGRLPMSIPRNSGQLPVYYNRKPIGKVGGWEDPYKPYLDQPFGPLYPFGFGLGYTTFEVDGLKLSADTIPVGGTAGVSAGLRNTGACRGSTVVQCYVRDAVSSRTRPQRELKGFRRVTLDTGEECEVRFALGPDELGFHGAGDCWTVEPGEFRVFVGLDSRAERSGVFRVGGA